MRLLRVQSQGHPFTCNVEFARAAKRHITLSRFAGGVLHFTGTDRLELEGSVSFHRSGQANPA